MKDMNRIVFVPGLLLLFICSAAAEDFCHKTELFSGSSFAFFKDTAGVDPAYSVGSFDFGVGAQHGYLINFSAALS